MDRTRPRSEAAKKCLGLIAYTGTGYNRLDGIVYRGMTDC